MKSKLEPYREEIIKLYQEGKTGTELASQYDVCVSNMCRFLSREGVSRKRKSLKRVNITENVLKDFQKGQLYEYQIAEKYNTSIDTIKAIVHEAGFCFQSGYKTNCKTDYFKTIDSPHKAYLLGFIVADGGVVNDVLAIEVHEKDKEILEFAKQQINPKASLTKCFYDKKRNWRVSFGAKQLAYDLRQYGVVQNKSKKIESTFINRIPQQFQRFYFRGLVDGDGYVGKNGQVSIYSGSKPFIRDVQKQLIEKVGVSPLKIYHGTSYFVSWSSKADRKKLFDYLYGDCLNETFFYKRKYIRLLNSLTK